MVDNLEISGSDARRIMAGEGLDVWREHTGRKEPRDLRMFLPAMIGLATEKVNRLYYKYKTGRTVYDPRPTGGVNVDYDVVAEDHLGIKLRSKSFKWMVGHLDGLVTEADKWGVFESKHTGAVSDCNQPAPAKSASTTPVRIGKKSGTTALWSPVELSRLTSIQSCRVYGSVGKRLSPQRADSPMIA